MERPNLIYIFPDQLRRQALGFMNADPVHTPRLDQFAGEGVVFTRAISNFPVCSPYRASLLTGKYPLSNGVVGNCSSRSPHITLRAEERCFTDVLHDAGYNVGWIGKWHLDAPHEPFVDPINGRGECWNEYTPPELRHGCDFWYCNGCFNDHLHTRYWIGDAPRDGRVRVDQWSLEHETDVALDYLRNEGGARRDPDKPFALFLSWNPPHPPYIHLPEALLEPYADKSPEQLLTRGNVPSDVSENIRNWVRYYFAAITGLDTQFGRIMDCLAELGLDENTLVVFTSDHGDMMGSHGLLGKTVHWEESLGVPLITRWKGRLAARRDDLLIGAPDMMPTVLGMLGLGEQVPPAVEGADLSETVLTGSGLRPDSALYMRLNGRHAWNGERGVVTHRWKLVIQREERDGQRTERRWLGDLEEDPLELTNCLQRHPEVEQRLVSELNGWLQRTGDPWTAVSPDHKTAAATPA